MPLHFSDDRGHGSLASGAFAREERKREVVGGVVGDAIALGAETNLGSFVLVFDETGTALHALEVRDRASGTLAVVSVPVTP